MNSNEFQGKFLQNPAEKFKQVCKNYICFHILILILIGILDLLWYFCNRFRQLIMRFKHVVFHRYTHKTHKAISEKKHRSRK